MHCIHCGSARMEEGVAIGKSAEAGSVGPKYKAGLFTGVSQLYCDLCLGRAPKVIHSSLIPHSALEIV